VPVIRRLQSTIVAGPAQTVILDCPPGASCPVVAAMRAADYLLLVTEPTPFGLHDLRQAAEVARELGIPAGVIVNRDNGPYPELDDFCRQAGLPVLLRIPFERRIAEGVARGENLLEIHPEYGDRFRQMFHAIQIDSRFRKAKGV
jgi:MinD superfamily P-loop ATPase